MAKTLKTVEELLAFDIGNQLIALRGTEVRLEQVALENDALRARLAELSGATTDVPAQKNED